jgi:hypothetical protein
MKPCNKKGFKELQRIWYEKIKEKGFEDIEDTKNPERPLKCWHSFKFKLKPIVQTNAQKDFFEMASGLLHSFHFKTKHYRKIWRLFCEGQKEREIARKLKIPKSTVHWIIARISREIKWK